MVPTEANDWRSALIGVLPSFAGEEEHDLYCGVSLKDLVLLAALIWATQVQTTQLYAGGH